MGLVRAEAKGDGMKRANWTFEVEVGFMGYNRHEYPGAFPDKVEDEIKVVANKFTNILHLFSGTSKIGNTRIDLERPEATRNIDVFEWLQTDEAKKRWELVILDPPYAIINAETELKEYGDSNSVSASIPKRNALSDFFKQYCENVLWLDHCAPIPEGFIRKKVWFFFPGGYRNIRVLSWLFNDFLINQKKLSEYEKRNPKEVAK